MSTRTAAIVIDNFLPNDQWNWIQDRISEYLNTDTFVENRNDPYPTAIEWIKEKLSSFDFYQEHWNSNLLSWSFINSLPSNIDRESSGTGYHIDFGGFIYYIHPTWNASWGGHLLFQDCNVDKIEPKPNRFVWINPKIHHGIEVVNDNATHNRITIVGWPEGCVEYSGATQQINTVY
tara:strand:- start:1155 stop:1685 length:531 start_codon:yes stop_codon:yes gene_type:complete